MKFGAELVTEMAGMQVRVTSSGREQFGAWREGSHDDLVFAVALACWNTRKAWLHDTGGNPDYWTVCLKQPTFATMTQVPSVREPVVRQS